jgi:AcrR family transcriptional regulator
MSRTANEKRPEELRQAIVQYLIKHGLTGLSLRPLAKAVSSSPRSLLYYFGSKEKMVVEVLGEVRQQQCVSYGDLEAGSFGETCLAIWKRMSASDAEPLFRLFFEAYGMALRQPKLYRVFLRDTIGDWLRLIADPLCREGYRRAEARAFATVILAGLRGFMLDYCNTRDHERLDRAVGLWARTLDSMLLECKRSGEK